MAGGRKNVWEERRAAIRSLDLTGIAAELNVARLKRAVLAGERITALPGDRRAGAARMKQCLAVLIEACGQDRAASLSHRQVRRRLAQQGIAASRNTVRRAIEALAEACLVRVRRRSTAARGDGANEYVPIWPTLIDVARTQGLQGELFDVGGRLSGRGERNRLSGPQRSGRLSDHTADAGGQEGTAATASPRGTPPKRLSATGQSSPPVGPTQGGPPKDGHPPAHLWAPPCPFMGTPLPIFPDAALSMRARAEDSSPLRGEEERSEEEETSSSSDSARAVLAARLERYGVAPWAALRSARTNGWSLGQVAELLAWCESQVVAGEKAFGPGIVFRHLERFPAGAPLTAPPREAYTRAKRDRDLRMEREREARRRRADEQRRRSSATADRRRRERFGERLAAMSRAEKQALLERCGMTVDVGFVPDLTWLELLEREAAGSPVKE